MNKKLKLTLKVLAVAITVYVSALNYGAAYANSNSAVNPEYSPYAGNNYNTNTNSSYNPQYDPYGGINNNTNTNTGYSPQYNPNSDPSYNPSYNPNNN